MKLSDELWADIGMCAKQAGVTRTVVVETAVRNWLMVTESPSSDRDAMQAAESRPVVKPAAGLKVPALCRCGHGPEKHTPKCYVMACMCREYRS